MLLSAGGEYTATPSLLLLLLLFLLLSSGNSGESREDGNHSPWLCWRGVVVGTGEGKEVEAEENDGISGASIVGGTVLGTVVLGTVVVGTVVVGTVFVECWVGSDAISKARAPSSKEPTLAVSSFLLSPRTGNISSRVKVSCCGGGTGFSNGSCTLSFSAFHSACTSVVNSVVKAVGISIPMFL